MRDRRISFFLGAAVVCVALVPVADPAHRWVAWTIAAAYVVLTVLVSLDSWSRRREAPGMVGEEEEEARRNPPPPPFAPPPWR